MIASVRILTKKTENVYFVDQVTGFDAAIKKLKLNEKTKKETSFLQIPIDQIEFQSTNP